MKYLALIFISFILIGCSSAPKYNTLEVKEKEIVKVTIPDYLLIPCVPERPMSKEEYLKLKQYEREIYLTNYSITLLSVIKNCNDQIEAIKKLNN